MTIKLLVFIGLIHFAFTPRPAKAAESTIYRIEAIYSRLVDSRTKLERQTLENRSSDNSTGTAGTMFSRKGLPLEIDLEPEALLQNCARMEAKLKVYLDPNQPRQAPTFSEDTHLAESFLFYLEHLRQREHEALLLIHANVLRTEEINIFSLRGLLFPKFRNSTDRLIASSIRAQRTFTSFVEFVRAQSRAANLEYTHLLDNHPSDLLEKTAELSQLNHVWNDRFEHMFKIINRGASIAHRLVKAKRRSLPEIENFMSRLGQGLKSSLVYAEKSYPGRKKYSPTTVAFESGIDLNSSNFGSRFDLSASVFGLDLFQPLYSRDPQDGLYVHREAVTLQYVLVAGAIIGQAFRTAELRPSLTTRIKQTLFETKAESLVSATEDRLWTIFFDNAGQLPSALDSICATLLIGNPSAD